MSWDDILNFFSSIGWSDKITAVVISATVSYIVTKKSIKDSNYQEKIKNLCSRIEKAEELGENYWSQKGALKPLERKIVSKLGIINDDINELNSKFLKRNNVEQKMIDFRQSITGGLFESGTRKDEPGRIAQIRESASRLRSAMKLC
ncbi:MAG: hypothetical protein PF482_04435 [Desulfobacteraceae bacterium]|jgi:hypothetical protein|nr:hypothetical protein [Desulfobacteraceae bacterium]